MGDATREFAAYTLESIFMQSADSITYRAVRTATGEAVLILVPHMPEDWEEIAKFREGFLAAAQRVRQLRHPGILEVRDIGVDEASGMPFIAYEAISGASLGELTAGGKRMPDTDIARVGAAVAEALDHAHRAGFVHGAVAPPNILAGPDGTVRLAGFGVESAAHSPTEMRGHAGGTGAYASPEQILGGAVDGRSDLFSLGIVLFELVTGEHPFLATPPRDARDRIVADEVPLAGKIRSDAPGGFNGLIFKLLQKDPAKRPANGAEVAGSLRALHARLLQPPPVLAPPSVARPVVVARPRLSPLPLAIGGGVVVLAAAIAAVILLRPAQPPAETSQVQAAPSVETAELAKALNDAEAAVAAGDFNRAGRALAEARRIDPLNARGLDLSQRARTMRDEKAKRLYDEGLALGRLHKYQEAERKFDEVIAIDPDNVDAKDQIDSLHEMSRPAPHEAPQAAAPSTASLPKPTPTVAPPRRLRVVFNSPLPAGDLALAVDRRPFAAIPFDFASSGGAGVVERAFEMQHGRHQILVTLHNQQGLTLGDQAFVLDFQPGRTFLLKVEMSGPRAAPRFSATEVR